MKNIELISVFYKTLPTYNPQGLKPFNKIKSNGAKTIKHSAISAINGGEFKTDTYIQEYTNYPTQFLSFKSEANTIHPTQKPVELGEYLIKTYTDEGMTVMDNTMGSGSTGVACKNTNRQFIGIELDEEYFKIAKERIEG